jgi:topoisomerase-4 subunit A
VADLPNDAEIVAALAFTAGERLLVASSGGRGFLVKSDEVLAQTRAGKQILNVGKGEGARFCLAADGDTVAIIGQNRKLLIFRMDEVPELARGRGVILQRYREGGTADIKVFSLAEGLSWRIGERIRTETNLLPWLGRRATVGRLPPTGFPRSNLFN